MDSSRNILQRSFFTPYQCIINLLMGEIGHDTEDLEYFALPRSPQSNRWSTASSSFIVLTVRKNQPVESWAHQLAGTHTVPQAKHFTLSAHAVTLQTLVSTVALFPVHFQSHLAPVPKTLTRLPRGNRWPRWRLFFRKFDSAVRWCCDKFIIGVAGAREEINHL